MANSLWGTPRIHCELLMLGIEIAQSTVAQPLCRDLDDHHHRAGKHFSLTALPALLPLSVRGADGIFQTALWFGDSRSRAQRLVGFGVTAHPTAEWVALRVTDAFPWDSAPRYLIRDRRCCVRTPTSSVCEQGASMIVRAPPVRPGKNGYAERLIGSIRSEFLGPHTLVFRDAYLRHILKAYANYCNEVRIHLSLGRDASVARAVQTVSNYNNVPSRRFTPPVRQDLILVMSLLMGQLSAFSRHCVKYISRQKL
jgi:hypothetical protein